MARVFMMCGKICSGKSTHARVLREKHHAVILSVDEITLALFGQDAGDRMDEYVLRLKKYLYAKSLEVLESGINVVLDWGFWTKKEREFARNYYGSAGIANEFHYIEVDDREWHRRLEQRNHAVINHQSDAYYVDEGLAAKFQSVFEKPEPDEIDCWIKSSSDPCIPG